MPADDWTPVEGSSVKLRFADADDLERFGAFDCVDPIDPTPSAAEINRIIRGAEWAAWEPAHFCLEFASGDEVVGYVVVALDTFYHPHFDDLDEELYLNAVVTGVDVRFQGRPDLASPTGERYSDVILRALEQHVARAQRGAVGIYSIVRLDNHRAMRQLSRNEYAPDGGSFRDTSSGAQSTVWRKLRGLWR